MYLYIIIGLTVLGLIQWYLDYRSKKLLINKYDNIMYKLAKMNSPAEKLSYTKKDQDGEVVIETKYSADNLDDLLLLINNDKPNNDNWFVDIKPVHSDK